MSITATKEQVKAPTTHIALESSLPTVLGKTPLKVHIGQFYGGLPPFMGGGEPKPVGLYLEVTDLNDRETMDGAPLHLTREDVEGLHAELGAWLDGEWGVDRPGAPA